MISLIYKTLKITSETSHRNHPWLYDKFNKVDKNNIQHIHNVSEQGNKFCMIDENILSQIENNDDVRLQGFLQCEKYFEKYRDDILKAFQIPSHIKSLIDKTYPNFKKESYYFTCKIGRLCQ